MNTDNQTPWGNRNEEDENSDSFSTKNDKSDYSNIDPEDELSDDELDEEDDLTDDAYPGELQEEEPDEIPEKHASENEHSEYPHETEVQKPNGGADTSYSEGVDVTPPSKHEFPSVGHVKTDFESRPHGRTTGRMVGHEPGTEGI